MRLPVLEVDRWDLVSAEERHAAAPGSFLIPSRPEREQLQPGQAAKLLFRIESSGPDGSVDRGVDRMWVFITERVDGLYVGILDNDPGRIEATEDAYLVRGAEVPFGPEHVIDIGEPPAEYVDAMRAASPTRTWPRSEVVRADEDAGQRWIYHLAIQREWTAATASGVYERSTLDTSLAEQGFIHCSFASQVQSTGDRFYAGRTDVVLLRIDAEQVGAEIRVENLEGGEHLFPHIYGPLPVAAVVRADAVPVDANGRLVVEPLLRAS